MISMPRLSFFLLSFPFLLRFFLWFRRFVFFSLSRPMLVSLSSFVLCFGTPPFSVYIPILYVSSDLFFMYSYPRQLDVHYDYFKQEPLHFLLTIYRTILTQRLSVSTTSLLSVNLIE